MVSDGTGRVFSLLAQPDVDDRHSDEDYRQHDGGAEEEALDAAAGAERALSLPEDLPGIAAHLQQQHCDQREAEDHEDDSECGVAHEELSLDGGSWLRFV